jgi:hypothetical protein
MFDVLTAAGVLAGLGAFLALLLVLAERTLTSGGPTRLTVNDDQPRMVDGGDPLLGALKEQGILYVPDFLANRMGIVNCANEQYGSFDEDPAILVHLGRKSPAGIFQRALEVFKRAQQSGRTTAHEAELLANELMQQLHPIWGHRGQVIIDHLVQDGWDRG